MKMGGKPLPARVEEILVLPRGDENIVFRAKGLDDMDEFEKLCPIPKPPKRIVKGQSVDELQDPTYLQQLQSRGEKKLAFLMIYSLEPSEIEWDLVKKEDPNTWVKWRDELISSGLNSNEVERLIGLVLDANSLNEAKIKQAREDFLRGLQAE